ncbi:hypothetical protein PV318_03200 [Streptomyces sp. ME02-6991-2B]|nr:hypothetical protein [Streptomyces sp. ME02-6991-2B]
MTDAPRTLTLAVLLTIDPDTAEHVDVVDLAQRAAKWVHAGFDDRDGIVGVKVGSGASIVAEAYRRAADDIDARYTGPGVDQYARYAGGMLREYAAALDEADAQIPAEYVDPDDEDEPDTYRVDDRGLPTYARADVDGDRLLIACDAITGQGAGLYFRTDRNGSSVPAAELPELIARLQQIADAARVDVEQRAADDEETAR